MIKNGFLYENIILEAEDSKIYRIPFYFKGKSHINITASDGIKMENIAFRPSKNKQYVAFTLGEKFDKSSEHYLNFNTGVNTNVEYKKLSISFDKKFYNLNTNKIDFGENGFVIYKDAPFKNPTLTLSTPKGNKKINFETVGNSILFKFNIEERYEYSLSLKDGLKIKKFNLVWDNEKQKEDLDNMNIYTKLSYNKGKIKLRMDNSIPFKEDTELIVTGDLNCEFVWKKGSKSKIVNIAYQVLKWKIFKFKIKNNIYSGTVINQDYFPKKITKTSTGIRLDKATPEGLTLKIGETEYKIPAKSLIYDVEWKGVELVELYFKDILLDSQKISKKKYKPQLVMVNNPLRIKLSHIYFEDVTIQFKDSDKMYIIPAGETELAIEYKNKGARHFEITSVENANVKATVWNFLNL